MKTPISYLIIVLIVTFVGVQRCGLVQLPMFTSWAFFASIALVVMWNCHQSSTDLQKNSDQSNPNDV